MITKLNMWGPKPYMFLYDCSWKSRRRDSNTPARKQQQDRIASKPNLMGR